MTYFARRRSEIIGPGRQRRPRRDIVARAAARAASQRAEQRSRAMDQRRAALRLQEAFR